MLGKPEAFRKGGGKAAGLESQGIRKGGGKADQLRDKLQFVGLTLTRRFDFVQAIHRPG